MIESWLSAHLREGELSRRRPQKMVVPLNGIFKRARKVWKLTHNPMADIERLTVPKRTPLRRSTRSCVPRPTSRTALCF